MPLLKNNAIATDSWTHLADDEALPATGSVTVSVDRLAKDWDQLAKFTGLLGARLTVTTRIQDLQPYLPQLALVALPFQAFNDGRAYSLAKQLRLDGYTGELRATGNVLPDQYQFMHQVGFDSYEISERFPLEMWKKASRQMSLAYQRGLVKSVGEREVWSERHRGFAAWEEQPHAG